MLLQVLIGSGLIIATVVVTVIFIEIAIVVLKKGTINLIQVAGFRQFSLVLTATALWLLLALSAAMWVWAFGFYYIGAFATFEEALYFSMASFTTLGYGDVLLPQEWRLLSGFAAANGLMLFGLNAALLTDVMLRMRRSRLERSDGS